MSAADRVTPNTFYLAFYLNGIFRSLTAEPPDAQTWFAQASQ
jgi:hypothetical protein